MRKISAVLPDVLLAVVFAAALPVTCLAAQEAVTEEEQEAVSAEAEQEAAEQETASAETEIPLSAGRYVALPEAGMMMWVPSFLEPYELSEEERGAGWIAYYEDEEEKRQASVQMLKIEDLDLESYAEAIPEYGAADVKMTEVGALPAVSYSYAENDAYVLCFNPEEGVFAELSFAPMEDEAFAPFIDRMAASAALCSGNISWDEEAAASADLPGDFLEVKPTGLKVWIPEGMEIVDYTDLTEKELADVYAEGTAEEGTEPAPAAEEAAEPLPVDYELVADLADEESGLFLSVYRVLTDLPLSELSEPVTEEGASDLSFCVANGMRALTYHHAEGDYKALIVDTGSGLIEFDYGPVSDEKAGPVLKRLGASIQSAGGDSLRWGDVSWVIDSYALVGDFDELECGFKLWIPAEYAAVELTEEEKASGYLRGYEAENGSVITAGLYQLENVQDLDGVRAILHEMGIKDEAIHPLTVNGIPMLYYENGEGKDSLSFAAVTADGVLEITCFPYSDENTAFTGVLVIGSLQEITPEE